MALGSSISALLGPTNTGKTHRAIERMLEHPTGMMGLPLRLLAREVYDKVSTRVGENAVALITGEEKRIPKAPAYWIATVEAMPVDLEVDFLAVDEIQWAGHAQRGHIFTERLLRARGLKETWFLGADTLRPVLAQLLPTAKVIQHPRLSRLTYGGEKSLARLPPRTAVVAFSMNDVYEVAERLRREKGGAAVVMGALSPRARNAQVALFQSGEVDYVVATDAIGMGLNLNVHHVAFASLRKFDGRTVRGLDASEVAQIAGRAGRYLQDGTFGTVAPLSMDRDLVEAVEHHHFPFQRSVWYRPHPLCFDSIDALVESLGRPPPRRCLALSRHAEDREALVRLAERECVRAQVRKPADVELLWEVCQVPDFRRLLFEVHVDFLAEVFGELRGPHRCLTEDWVAPRVAEVDDLEGDVEHLLAKMAAIRTWTYLAQKGDWIHRADHWRERTLAIEERLSQRLHQRLVERFVERSAKAPRPVSAPRSSRRHRPQEDELLVEPHHPFAALRRLRAEVRSLEPASDGTLGVEGAWAEALADSPHEAFGFDEGGTLFFQGRRVARCTPGVSLTKPDVALVDGEGLGAGLRSRVHRRLVAYARDIVGGLVGPLRTLGTGAFSPAWRGLFYQLQENLGTVAIHGGLPVPLDDLDEEQRAFLKAQGVVLGTSFIYADELLTPEALRIRRLLVGVKYKGGAVGAAITDAPSLRVEKSVTTAMYLALGYVRLHRRAIRVDVLDRMEQACLAGQRDPVEFARWVGCSPKEVEGELGTFAPLAERASKGVVRVGEGSALALEGVPKVPDPT